MRRVLYVERRHPHLGPLICTLVACPQPEGQQFAGIMDGTSQLDKDGDELEIESSEGTLVLTR